MQSASEACPYLGLAGDATLRLSYIDSKHRCYALSGSGEPVDEETQARLCLGGDHPSCPRFAAAGQQPAPAEAEEPRQQARSNSRLRIALWALAGILAVAAVVLLAQVLAPPEEGSPGAVETAGSPAAAETAAWPTPPPAGTALALAAVSTPTLPSPPTATPPAAAAAQAPAQPDDVQVKVTPAPDSAGWVTSGEGRGNHLGDSYLYAGIFEGQLFHGIIQFDLSRVPRGAPIRGAALAISGLDDNRLDRTADGIWEVRWLAQTPEDVDNFNRLNFQDFHNTPVFQTILPSVDQAELSPLAVNQFVFNDEQLRLLEKAIVDEQPLLTLRIDGPQTGGDNLFAWDTGTGPATLDIGPVLILTTGPAPATPPPVPTRDFIVVTSTPTPENVLTAAAIAETATAVVRSFGTFTPTPRAMVTATPTPGNEATAAAERLFLGLPPVITATPPPVNVATETAIARYKTAVAVTTGTITPVPDNAVTATATPTYVVVTNTPTPANIATLLAQVIAEATRTATAGPPTQFPPGVATATPTLTSTPVPQNQATAAAQRVIVTIWALTTGTYTPTPTATFTPTPTPTATAGPSPTGQAAPQPTPTPAAAAPSPQPPTPAGPAAPSAPQPGQIIFRSDRAGEPQFFVMDSACVTRQCGDEEIVPLADVGAFAALQLQEGLAPDGRNEAFVQADSRGVPQVFVRDRATGNQRQLVNFEALAYDPAWSPAGGRIALVSPDPGNDEIFVVNPDGGGLQRLTFDGAWDKHPTWSPDGSLILFYSQRSGRNQLWVMRSDGSDLRNISNSVYNDWDPIWVK